MNNYLVFIKNIKTREVGKTICETNDDLAKLLLHIDNDEFEIVDLAIVDGRATDYINFCKKNSELELGK